MSTHSRIGIVRRDGTVRSIYCHYDGYYTHNGRILLEHYQEPAKIEKLLEGGDLRSLGANLDPAIKVKESGPFSPLFTGPTPLEDTRCDYFARDLGEDFEDVKPQDEPTIHAFLAGPREHYTYLYHGGKWKAVHNDRLRPLAQLVKQALAKKEKAYAA